MPKCQLFVEDRAISLISVFNVRETHYSGSVSKWLLIQTQESSIVVCKVLCQLEEIIFTSTFHTPTLFTTVTF